MLSDAQESRANPAIEIIEGEWEPWFAWRPVRLYSTARLVWLRPLHRRWIVKFGLATCEYTDAPDQFPTYHPD
jgi:hypothetical protein